MKTKIVYSVISDGSGPFLEQLLFSLTTLRHFTPKAYVELVTDHATSDLITSTRPNLHSLLDKVTVVDIPEEFTNPAPRSRYIKTTLRKHVEGDYLFIDTDTAIAADLSSIDEIVARGVVVAAVPDMHLTIEELIRIWPSNTSKKFLPDPAVDHNYFNSGVMLVTDSKEAYLLYEAWYRNWLERYHELDVHYDQPALALAIREMPDVMCHLDDVWNCQIEMNGLPYLGDSKIIHYFAGSLSQNTSRPYIMTNPSIINSIKKGGKIPDGLMRYIERPKSAFHPKCNLIINEGSVKEILESKFRLLLEHYPRHYRILHTLTRLYISFLWRLGIR